MKEEFRKIVELIKTDKLESENMFYREACRGVIIEDDKIYLLKSKKFGDYSTPGGGVNDGESYFDALKREVLEEAGIIIKNPIPYGYTLEVHFPMNKQYDLFKMKSFVFLCEIESIGNPTNYEDYEVELGYSVEKVSIDEALNVNKNITNPNVFWLEREIAILEDLKINLFKKIVEK